MAESLAARVLMCGIGGSNLELYRTSLEEEGCHVHVLAELGGPVLDLFSDLEFDLVIFDTEALDPDQFSFLEELHRISGVPTLVIARKSPELEIAEKAREIGVREVLRRPFPLSKLVRAVRAGQEQAGLERAVAGEPVPRPVVPDWQAKLPRVEAELEVAKAKAREAETDRAKLDGLRTKLESMKALVRRKDQEIALLKADHKTLEKQLESLEKKKASLEEHYQETVDQHHGTLEERRAIQERSLAEAREEFQAAIEQLEVSLEAQKEARKKAEAEVQGLMQELEERGERHKRQIELLSQDDTEMKEAYEERVATLQGEIEELRLRFLEVNAEKEDLLKQMAEDRGQNRTLRSTSKDLESQLEELRQSREDQKHQFESELRKVRNEVNALVRERKKIADEHHKISAENAKRLEDELSQRKRLQLEYESLKSDLPTERRKVHALVDYQRSLTETVLAGLLTVDTSGIITLGNELAAQHLETKLSNLLGAHVDQCEAFAPLRSLFAESLASGKAGPTEIDIRPGFTLRAVATKVPFGPRELILFSVIAPEKIEIQVETDSSSSDEGPLARLGASVAGNITDVQDFAIEIRSSLERLYGATETDSEARVEVNDSLRRVGELIDFLRDIIEQAETYLS